MVGKKKQGELPKTKAELDYKLHSKAKLKSENHK
jgi:hypothetical protein